jgi:hypothetical protein
MIHRGPGFLPSYIWLLPHPLPPSPVTRSKAEKERQLADRRWGGGVGGGARSYVGEKSWSSINHSILSVYLHYVTGIRRLILVVKQYQVYDYL